MKINQIYNVLNTAAQEAFGAQAMTVKNGSDFVALGNHVLNSSSQESRDLFTGAITDLIGKTVIMNRAYTTGSYPFMVDSFEFGAIYRRIRVSDPTLIDNLEWNPTADSDQFDYVPIVAHEYLFQNLGTWSKMISIPDFQLRSAFDSEASMTAFYASIYEQLERAMSVAIETTNRIALATFIAEKLNLQTEQPNKIHAINVLEIYNTTMEKTVKAADVYTDKDFMKFFARLLKLYKPRLEKLSVAFNSLDIATHSPDNYQDLYMVSDITSGFAAYLESDTFHNELVSLPNYHDIPYWQAPGLSYSTEDTTAIKIKLASDNLTVVNKTNILGVIVDREAIATYFELDTTETSRDARKKITNQIRSATRGMLCDTGENGIVFYAEDVE